MPVTETWTVGRLLTWTADYLKKQGSESPRLEAEVLLAFALGRKRIELYMLFKDEVDEQPRSEFRELVKRRAAGEPVAYLVGQREFYSLEFQVSPAVLIPRPDTETLVGELIEQIKQDAPQQPPHIADVGSGSGAICVSVLKHGPPCRFTAADYSPEALAQTRANAEKHGVAEQLDLHEGDLLEGLDESVQFDHIVSNPPYISQVEWEQLPLCIKDYEPSLALIGGPSGAEVIARFIPQAARHLRGGGWLMMEISPMIEKRVRELLEQDGNWETPQTVCDLGQLPRVVKARRLSAK